MKIDDRLSDKQACIIPLGLIAMNVITACEGKLTDTAAVYGLGTIGILDRTASEAGGTSCFSAGSGGFPL